MTDVAVRQQTALSIAPGQTEFNEAQVATLTQLGVVNADRANLAVFFHQSTRTGLDPFAKQIYMIARQVKERVRDESGRWVDKYVTKFTIQTGIDGYRLIARRAADKARVPLSVEDTLWCGPDGQWVDAWVAEYPPTAAKVTVWRGDERFSHVSLWREYVQTYYNRDAGEHVPNSMWQKMPANQLAKCFSPDTEVLTDSGFMRFSEITDELIMQVTDGGLEAVRAIPFVQKYAGPMVTINSERLDFKVTPNHDMVTTYGKVEAGAMFATTPRTARPTWRIPLISAGRKQEDESWGDDDLRLAGYILADGYSNGGRRFDIAVSRKYKRDALHALSPDFVSVRHARGDVALAVRPVRSNFDKEVFSFSMHRVSRLFDDRKKFRGVHVFQRMSQRQVRIFVDAWQEFDGHTRKKTGVRTLYSSRLDHVRMFEVLSIMAGYSISGVKTRYSDISDKPNYWLTIGTPKPSPVTHGKHDSSIHMEPNDAGEVWCVTVPSGKIITRRNGFSMVVGNCAEAGALRKAFPLDLSGLYTDEEMPPAEPGEDVVDEAPQTVRRRRPVRTQAAEQTQVEEPPAADLEPSDDVVEQPPAEDAPEPQVAAQPPVEDAQQDDNQAAQDAFTQGLDAEPVAPAPQAGTATDTQPASEQRCRKLTALLKPHFAGPEPAAAWMSEQIGRQVTSTADLTVIECEQLITELTQ
ncbi:recombinase RecT [Glutamicibacter creatinolyticus]|uniref:recombinase RecT n=1 Tax=Glutamicibacter creatinolyticus TaxID=162496 RepID=UPI0031D248D2